MFLFFPLWEFLESDFIHSAIMYCGPIMGKVIFHILEVKMWTKQMFVLSCLNSRGRSKKVYQSVKHTDVLMCAMGNYKARKACESCWVGWPSVDMSTKKVRKKVLKQWPETGDVKGTREQAVHISGEDPCQRMNFMGLEVGAYPGMTGKKQGVFIWTGCMCVKGGETVGSENKERLGGELPSQGDYWFLPNRDLTLSKMKSHWKAAVGRMASHLILKGSSGCWLGSRLLGRQSEMRENSLV